MLSEIMSESSPLPRTLHPRVSLDVTSSKLYVATLIAPVFRHCTARAGRTFWTFVWPRLRVELKRQSLDRCACSLARPRTELGQTRGVI